MLRHTCQRSPKACPRAHKYFYFVVYSADVLRVDLHEAQNFVLLNSLYERLGLWPPSTACTLTPRELAAAARTTRYSGAAQPIPLGSAQ